MATLATGSVLGLAPTAGAAAVPAAAVPAAAVAAAPQMASFDQQMIKLVNTARAANGRSALTEARGLTTDAVWWSNQLSSGATSYQLAHNPDAWTMVASNGASNRTSWGENVGWSSSTGSTAQDIFTAYMNSPGHRANILSASYHFIGMGTVGGSHGLWNTTEFTDKVLAGQAVVVVAPPAIAVTKARSLIAAWYVDLLGRPADAGTLAARAGALVGGMTQANQVRTIQTSTAALTHLVGQYYTQYLHRSGDAAGIAARVAQLHAGATPGTIASGLLGSAEALSRAGGTKAAWVTFAFKSALGRNPTATEVANWAGLAARSGLLAAATNLVNSGTAVGHRVAADYVTYLGRVGSAGGIANWVKTVYRTGELNVQTAFMTSAEYVGRHS